MYFFLKMLWFFWTLTVLLQRWCSTFLVLCTHNSTGKQRKPRVRNILKSLKKNTIFNEHPVFHSLKSICQSVQIAICLYALRTLYIAIFGAKKTQRLKTIFGLKGIKEMLSLFTCVNCAADVMKGKWIIKFPITSIDSICTWNIFQSLVMHS